MTLRVPRLPLSLDPLMAEAKRRARQRRVLFSAAGLVAVALALALFFAIGGGSGAGGGQSSGAARPSGAGRSGVAPGESVTIRPSYFVTGSFGGIRKPPGGAELRNKHRLLLQRTVVGPAAIWVAPDWAVRGSCAWLTIRQAVYGGECRRSEPQRHGLSEVIPLRLPINGHILTLLWGNVGREVTSLEVHFQDGTTTRLPLTNGVFFQVFPKQRWLAGHRPSLLVARDGDGFAFRKRLISSGMFAH
jgi:hypothetical protein